VYYKHVTKFILWPADLRHCVPWHSKRNLCLHLVPSKQLVFSYQTAQCHNQADYYGNHNCHENLTSEMCKIFTALRTCRPGYFQCHNNRCVPSNQTCNQVNDCGDFSDELNCSCSSDDHFRCASGQCILASFRCDSDPDCPDASDEMQCESE